jgi:hypothetical protein
LERPGGHDFGPDCITFGPKSRVSSLYDEAPDTKTKLKISAELRLIEQAVARLVRLVKTDLAQPESMTTVKARKAARRRWDRDAAS